MNKIHNSRRLPSMSSIIVICLSSLCPPFVICMIMLFPLILALMLILHSFLSRLLVALLSHECTTFTLHLAHFYRRSHKGAVLPAAFVHCRCVQRLRCQGRIPGTAVALGAWCFSIPLRQLRLMCKSCVLRKKHGPYASYPRSKMAQAYLGASWQSYGVTLPGHRACCTQVQITSNFK